MNRNAIKTKIVELIENSINANDTANKIINLFVKKKRSLSQNALYWLWLACLEDETGNDKEDLHEYFPVCFYVQKLYLSAKAIMRQ